MPAPQFCAYLIRRLLSSITYFQVFMQRITVPIFLEILFQQNRISKGIPSLFLLEARCKEKKSFSKGFGGGGVEGTVGGGRSK